MPCSFGSLLALGAGAEQRALDSFLLAMTASPDIHASLCPCLSPDLHHPQSTDLGTLKCSVPLTRIRRDLLGCVFGSTPCRLGEGPLLCASASLTTEKASCVGAEGTPMVALAHPGGTGLPGDRVILSSAPHCVWSQNYCSAPFVPGAPQLLVLLAFLSLSKAEKLPPGQTRL